MDFRYFINRDDVELNLIFRKTCYKNETLITRFFAR